jgi:hypothetical protein
MTTSKIAAPRAGRNSGKGKSKAPSFNVPAWREELVGAACQMITGATAMLRLVVSARGLVEADTVRESLQDAFAQAYCATNDGIEYEAALKAPSVRNRVSEGMAVFNCEELPADMQNNIQHAASACRAAKAGKRAPKTPKAPAQEGTPASPLALLQLAIDGLTKQAGDNATLLSLLGDLKDLAHDIAGELNAPSGDVIEGDFEEVEAA